MRHRLAAALAAAVLLAAFPVRATEEASDARLFGAVLALVQQFVRAAAAAPDADAARRRLDELLAGRDAEANRAAGEILAELLAEVPAAQRATLAAIAKDLLVLARREHARAPADHARSRAIAARKELHAMGLRYWDEQQYREALARGDHIAAALFREAQGLSADGLRNPPPAR